MSRQGNSGGTTEFFRPEPGFGSGRFLLGGNMMFEVKETHARADLFALHRATLLKTRNSTFFSRISSVLVGIPVIIAGVYTLWNVILAMIQLFQQGDTQYLLSILLGFVFSFALLDFGLLMLFNFEIFGFLFAWRGYRFKGVEFSYQFAPDSFTEQSQFGTSQLKYSIILQVVEDPSHYFLFVSGNAAHMLRKDAFTQGDPEQFREFIQQKTGKAVEFVK